MPINEPPTSVDQAFIDQVSAAIWQGGSVLIGDAALKPAIVDNKWALQDAKLESGLLLPQTAFMSLRDAKARTDGSFVSPSGAVFRLANVDGQARAIKQ